MAFHVVTQARIRVHPVLGTDDSAGNNGAFLIGSHEPGWALFCIAADGGGWDHVSVQAVQGKKSRIPKWTEMHFIKQLFWDDEDVVMQLHPAKSQYRDMHPHVLHLWRPTILGVRIPTPPPEFVAPDPGRGVLITG